MPRACSCRWPEPGLTGLHPTGPGHLHQAEFPHTGNAPEFVRCESPKDYSPRFFWMISSATCLRDLGVAVERHGVHSAALGLRTQVTDVAEHAGQRDVRTDDLDALCIFHGLHLATAGVEVTDNFTHVFLRGADLDIHQRFEQNRVRLACGFLESHTAGDLERHFRGVNIVVRAVNQRGLDADNRVTGQDAVVQCILDTGVNRRDVLAGNAATGDLVLELVQLAFGQCPAARSQSGSLRTGPNHRSASCACSRDALQHA